MFNFPENLDIEPSVHPNGSWRYSGDSGPESVFDGPAQREAIQKYGIAGRVWEAAYALSLYVHPPPNLQFDPPFVSQRSSRSPLTILELGSGAGLTSSHIANILNPHDDILIVTDLTEVCPLLESNLVACAPSTHPRNSLESLIFVRPLVWGNEAHSTSIASELLDGKSSPRALTHVMCSDLVYFPELLAPLLRTLIQLTSPPFSRVSDANNLGVTVVISYKIRSLSKETPFWSALGLWFNFEPVLVNDDTAKDGWHRFGASSDDRTFVFIAHRRRDSFAWKVPLDDRDLLVGKGAKGDDLAKADDTFETILFMALDNLEI
ncbi:Protein-lysine methyltransferase METTL21D [Hypsizygus marmoreus]|uniref:Protein-lysine methyltransferase METTL21D n=1 Tax=Hypsizygus marmoreus TaxID=39966 RepID=A0A369K2A2_HYPMA|nr:Protein-lysine methyltransferase METTL21D [Hypsizygus marmoreus]